MGKDIEELIKIYNAEILLAKKGMIKFALKNAIAYNTAQSKVVSYQRVVEDLKQILKNNKSDESKNSNN